MGARTDLQEVGGVNSGVGNLKVRQVCVLEKQVDLGSDEQGGETGLQLWGRQGQGLVWSEV